MLRLPAVAGRFYPAGPAELQALIHSYSLADRSQPPIPVRACLVPHAGYVYSGHVAGAVLRRIALPRKIIILGVRHYPRGEPAAILSSGAWRTPLGDARIDEALAEALEKACPLLRDDSVAHSAEHSLEVQLPFLQVLAPDFTFVPIALGTVQFESLVSVGEAIGQLLLLEPRGLYETCRHEAISMCGLGPAVAMLTALNRLGAKKPELVKYATSADVSGDPDAVVGYAGMIFC